MESDDNDGIIQPAENYRRTILGFKRLRFEKRDRFDLLDWTNVSKKIINALFPIQEGKYGHFDHPPAYLRSTELAQNWRKISHTDQRNKIKELNEEEEKHRRAQMRSKSAMSTSLAARAQGKTMMNMLMEYGRLNLNEKAGPTAYNSYILH
jgi:hypothetical protein